MRRRKAAKLGMGVLSFIMTLFVTNDNPGGHWEGQGYMVQRVIAHPLTDSANWLWNETRCCSPSVTTDRPTPCCGLIASSTARSSMALNRAGEIRPAAASSRAEMSSGGRSRLPMWSA